MALFCTTERVILIWERKYANKVNLKFKIKFSFQNPQTLGIKYFKTGKNFLTLDLSIFGFIYLYDRN
jgi:hypothetical protein